MGADNKATLEEIEAFLNEFKTKSKIFGIDYDRHKEENFQTLLDLEMPPDERTTYLYNLESTDYYQGPGKNDYDDQEGDVWMFGIGIKKKRGKKKKIPIYISAACTCVLHNSLWTECNAPNLAPGAVQLMHTQYL